MDVYIDDRNLLELYKTGRSRKLRLPGNVIDKFFATIQKIEEAINLYDLIADTGLHFERLQGYENRYSMRLSGKYRLEMEIEWQNEKKTIGVFNLKDISNHYND